LSRVIKASRITGEYRIDVEKIKKKDSSRDRTEKNSEPVSEQTSSAEDKHEEVEEDHSFIVQAKARAEEIVKEAQEKAAGVLEKAAREAEQKRQEAHEKGYEEGYEEGYHDGLEKGQKKGREEGLAEFKKQLSHFDDIIRKTRNELDRDAGELKRDLIDLIIKAVETILNTEVQINPEIINNIISPILKELSDFGEITIRVNPELTRYIVEEDFEDRYVSKELNFVADSSLLPGDCIIDTELGGLDASIETKLNQLKKELLKGAGYYEGS